GGVLPLVQAHRLQRRPVVGLHLVSVDSTVARAHHHAAGMAVDPELLDELEKVVTEEKGLLERGKAHR
ncbi:hypothetical protein ACWEPR_39175, partial [Streptomyces sp. NPDC004290]